MALQQAQVSVVVIGYDDAAHVADAVRSALAQGPAVREVIAVDDCSTDGSAELLERLAEDEPRLRVVRRTVNSGGCGTPRNTGLDVVTAPYVMFLDSDDVLPPGAVDALLAAALEHDAPVASGLCVRRELPSGRETPWQPELYARRTLVEHSSQRARLVQDTLCVNKLYRTSFLHERVIRFPEGRFPYEDFVFGARVLAAAPRVALVPDPVYVWHVRRSAARLSISLDRSDIANWRARLDADRLSYDILLGAGEKGPARATRTRFLDHSLRMYARELDLRGAEYRREWWTLTRGYLATFDEADFAPAPAPGRVVARVILAAEEPRDLPRLKEMSARPARLTPPYARAGDGTPVWSADLPQVELDHLLVRPVELLPAAVDAELRPRARGTVLRLRLHELYGRMAEAGPRTVEAEFTERTDGRVGFTGTAPLRAEAEGDSGPDASDVDSWTAEVPLDLAALGNGTWDLRLRLRFADGSRRETTAHALAGAGLLRRSALPSVRHGVLLVQPYATHAGALAVRLAPGWRGLTEVVRRRLTRLLH
ncbi:MULTISPECIES: glycosyltransferase family 2 protein [Streptomyces]|uniref:Glycosyltransferase family 2 protein n=1 Tax=Streptomyces caniscabiei TaxID=2746961 RepID=A0ABU4N6F2_9ACTN|nr:MULTISPECIES: glycosyltransferase family 2 protein [Streptomyces]MBE4740233.1 glycosyltransferase family 2 protein [Streptomyces caniscabiei]MBE4759123.1 glycosyltransferase family 2 protein [Streptomyces caniscabiei]MBE4772993.1 glycosyltransferase family 2 protein [Streptomyces caniscabiei]MBE4788119.1 glycosyltransferase family 2 protein [Streptomyces caniscabiei]MBE4797341.1 glycosyltransferase family 2 protein [Streptomyces caniscabiei]